MTATTELELVRSRALATRAWELRDRVRVGDGFCVASAELIRVPPPTADRRLARAALPDVTITVVS